MDSSPPDRVFIDQTPTIAFRVIPLGAAGKVAASGTEPEWPAALGLAAAHVWSRLRAYWGSRTAGDRIVLIAIAAVVLVLTGAGLASANRDSSTSDSYSTTASSSTWYSDLGPTGLHTSAMTVYKGKPYYMPTPTPEGLAQYRSDTGAADVSFGLLECSHVRYGESTFAEAKSIYVDVLHQSNAWAEIRVRAALLDLCPA